MSGIVALVNLEGAPVDRALLDQLTQSMEFRGPDAQESWIGGQAGLGHAMLSTDPSMRERQPCSLEGRAWIVADARVDGRSELRRKLHARGGTCPDQASDSELILHAYHTWGVDCVRHVIGDFAFVIWDASRRRLFCARDHLGVKPFFYARAGKELVLGNTLDCMRLHPRVSDCPNDLAISDFLIFGINQDPATSAFADINRLPPAHRLSWCDGKLRIDRYWELPNDAPTRHIEKEQCIEEFVEHLSTAVEDRMRSERIGVLMSGGLDSTSVAATAARMAASRAENAEVHAYCCVFDRLFADEERYFSGLVAEKLDLHINYLRADDYALFDRWHNGGIRLPEPMDEPLAAVYIDQARQIASRGRVALTGWDGDALFNEHVRRAGGMLRGGIRRAAGAMRAGRRAFARLRQFAFDSPSSEIAPLPAPKWFNSELAAQLNLHARWIERQGMVRRPHRHDRACRILRSPRFINLLECYDPGVTRIPVEKRHPLLDIRLIEFVFSLSVTPWCVDKQLLREAMHDQLPETVRQRPKTPLVGDPVIEHLQRTDASWVDTFEPAPGLERYVDRRAIPRIVGRGDADEMWVDLRPLCLDFWLRNVNEASRAIRRGGYHEVA